MYLPQQDAFHDAALRPEWETYPQSFLLDDDWNAKLLAQVERLYLSALSFGFITEPGTDRSIPSYLFKYNYDRGHPVVAAFSNIRRAASRELRAKSVGVAASSPGVLTIECPSHTANRILKVLAKIRGDSATYRNAYLNVLAWSKFKPIKAHEVPDGATNDLRRLCDLLDVETTKVLPALNRDDDLDPVEVLVAGKLVAAYYRALLRLLDRRHGYEFIGELPHTQAPVGAALEEGEYEEDDLDDDDYDD
jgi:hypothetical protein